MSNPRGRRRSFGAETPHVRRTRSFFAEERVDILANGGGTLHIGKVAAVFERHQAGSGKSLRNVLSGRGWGEFVVARNDQRGNAYRLELGQEVVVGLRPGVSHPACLDGSRFEDSFSCE